MLPWIATLNALHSTFLVRVGRKTEPFPLPATLHHPTQIDTFVRMGSTKFTLQSKLSDLHKYKNTKTVPAELKLKTITFYSACHANILSADTYWSTIINSVGNPQLSMFVDKVWKLSF